MRNILVVLCSIYLVGVDVLVGVSVVDLCVSELFSLYVYIFLLFSSYLQRLDWQDQDGGLLTESGRPRSTAAGAFFWMALGTADWVWELVAWD